MGVLLRCIHNIQFLFPGSRPAPAGIDLGLVVYTSYPILMGSWYPSSSGLIPQNIIGLPSGKFTVCYFQMAIEVDLLIYPLIAW